MNHITLDFTLADAKAVLNTSIYAVQVLANTKISHSCFLQIPFFA